MIRYSFLKSAAAALLIAGCVQPSAPPDTLSDPALEALYLERFEALQDRTGGSGLSTYDPLNVVKGADVWTPIPAADASERTISEDALTAAHAYADANNSSSFIVWRNGVIEAEHYFGDYDKTSLIVSKSLAKPLSVIAVGRAIERGAIKSLNQPIADFIPEWQDTPKEKILVRHILDMRSGLLGQNPAPTADNVLNRAYLHPAHDDVIIHEYPLVKEPGTRYEYANANSELVAPLIERATGVQYEDWISKEIFEPLGALGGEVWMNREGGTPHAGCCILLPAETFLRLAILLIEDGVWDGVRLLPEGFVEDMKTPTAENPHAGMAVYVGSPYIERRGAANPDVPYGKTLHSEPYLADDLFLFDGNSNQVVYIIPSEQLIIMRTGAWAPRDPEWDNAKLPNLILRGATP